MGLGFTAYLGWILSSLLGSVLGTFLPITELPGLNFVLPAMFIILLVMQIKEKREVFVAILAALLAPGLLIIDRKLVLSLANINLLAAIPTFLIAVYRNIFNCCSRGIIDYISIKLGII